MLPGRSTRLLAGILLLLLIGWTVRRCRGGVTVGDFHEEAVPGLDVESSPEIDQPRE